MVNLQRNASWSILLPSKTLPFAASDHLPRRALTLSLVICTALTISTAVAADYPERPVRVIVTTTPGSGGDINTRLLVGEMTRQMGRQFVVDNRPGANGQTGTDLIARAPPDGYTIGQGNNASLAVSRLLGPKLPYDLDRDIQAVSQYGIGIDILAVALSLPVTSVQELIDYARKNPGKLSFASGGNGTAAHLAGELFKLTTRTQITHVAYKGSQQAVPDMIGGQIHLMFGNASSLGAHVRAGRVRGLAVTRAMRSSSWPELPTLADSGVPNFEMTAWAGIVAPAGVSKVIVNQLNTAANKALATSTLKEGFSASGTEPTGGTPTEFAAFIKRETMKWAEVIKAANIKVD